MNERQKLRYCLDGLNVMKHGGTTSVVLQGWAGTTALGERVTIEVREAGNVFSECPADGERYDVLETFGRTGGRSGCASLNCGFHMVTELPDDVRRVDLVAQVGGCELVLEHIDVTWPNGSRRRQITGAVSKIVRAIVDGAVVRRTPVHSAGLWPATEAGEIMPINDNRAAEPVRSLFVTHNLNLEGAPKALFEVAAGLKSRGRIAPLLYSPLDGPIHALYRDQRIPAVVHDTTGRCAGDWPSERDYIRHNKAFRRVLRKSRPDVIIANTVENFFAVDAAAELGIPAVWIIYEGLDCDRLLDHFHSFSLSDALRAFDAASRIVFCSRETRDKYGERADDARSSVIHNGIDTTRIESHLKTVSREEARARIGAPAGKKVILTVGTVCERKSQHLLVEAAAQLRERRSDFCCYVVGLRDLPEGGYPVHVRRLVEELNLHDTVHLIRETDRVYDYLRAADTFVLASEMEGYSLAVMEAEAFGLPIVCTPCCGHREQTNDDNTLVFPFSDAAALADHLDTLLDDEALRTRMGCASRDCFESLTTRDQMLDDYEQVILAAAGRTSGDSGRVTRPELRLERPAVDTDTNTDTLPDRDCLSTSPQYNAGGGKNARTRIPTKTVRQRLAAGMARLGLGYRRELVKIFAFILNEELFIRDWLLHHGTLAGFENLHVVDNGSTDGTIEILRDFEKKGVHLYQCDDFSQKGAYISQIMQRHKTGARFLVPLDADEFIIHAERGDEGYQCDPSPELIRQSLKDLEYDGRRYKFGAMLTSSVSQRIIKDPVMNIASFSIVPGMPKIFFPASTFVATDDGNHQGEVSSDDPRVIPTNLCLIHYHHCGRDETYRRAVQMCKARNYDIDDADAMQRLIDRRVNSFHRLQYIQSYRRMLAEDSPHSHSCPEVEHNFMRQHFAGLRNTA